jgi:hypothetical protein
MNLRTLPSELCINIMEYTTPHICPTKRDRERLHKHAIQQHIYNKTTSGYNNNYTALYEYLNEDTEYIFTVLNTCKCCLRHQRNRPSLLTEHKFYPQNSTYLIEEIKCKTHICACPCRHITRFITNHLRDV